MIKITRLIKKIPSNLIKVALLIYAVNGYCFLVEDIKVEGLHRVKLGTVLNYLAVQIGEDISSEDTADIIRSLYETGFFQTVQLERDGGKLIVKVTERETIGSIKVEGNHDISSDQFKDILKNMGLVKGQIFQRASLEKLEKELRQVYVSRGKYNSSIKSHVTHESNNRVFIKIIISEGRVSRIKEIKFIGNKHIESSQLLQQMTLQKQGFFTFFTKKDQYSSVEMDASLEAIRSYYLDRGYIKFDIISSQVMISPDKKDVFITIHIHEGEQYKFAGYKLKGNIVLPKKQIDSLIDIKEGNIFSRKQVTLSISAISEALGNEGYGFPVINAEPSINEKNKTIFLTFYIEPGRHVYVRRINFHGNTKTSDLVLRQTIRQPEGGLLSLSKIKESERQLRNLSYLKDINIKTTPVQGSNNQVDLDVNVEEAPSAEASASAGYGTNGLQFNAALNQRNFMGTGRSVGLSFNHSNWGQFYSLDYYNPFYSIYGVGRGFNFYYQNSNPRNLDVVNLHLDKLGIDVHYNFTLGDKSSVQMGFGYQNLDILSPGNAIQYQNFVNYNGKYYDQIRLNTGYTLSNYDRLPFPKKGYNNQITGLVSLPASKESLSYYKASYQLRYYYPLPKDFVLNMYGDVGYGNQFNEQGLPIFEYSYAGGILLPGQVRGYYSGSLGPQDAYNNSLGGNLLTVGSVGVILPYPISRDVFRTTVFVDGGNLYSVNTPQQYKGSASGPLRFSAGLGFEWLSPFGPLSLSIAKPINSQPGDQKQIFQFTMSSGI